MQPGFWTARWERQQIGFHSAHPNPQLCAHWPMMARAGSRVLVPLCGKSVDMAWLAARGHRVVGVELSAIAVQAFFAEQGLAYTCHAQGSFNLYRSGAIEIWQGDFFELATEHIGHCTALYDRAALIALPPAMRKAYVEHLQQLLPAGCLGLMLSLEYAQEKIPGPPFSVLPAEVQALYGPGWALQTLACIDETARASPRFHAAGVTQLHERVYGLCKR
ncbi:thiopurine S-methyltransferase [Pseudomonas typographi]|uniref:thiopurine S-methyltransferase n=1 Tax=Pseudomonas typographi TaxID=2715964 RepID=UPI001687DF65|nr:thiopurine S-methyltransferase [Pseudomonas typographi]